MMRVLHLLATPSYSGPAQAVLTLARGQRAAGCEVHIQCDLKRRTALSEELLLPHLLKNQFVPDEHLELSVKSTPWAMLRDARWFSRQRFDVVHAHMSHDHLLSRVFPIRGATYIRSFHKPPAARGWIPFAHGYTVPSARYLPLPRRAPVLALPALLEVEVQPPVPSARSVRSSPRLGMISSFQKSRRHELGLKAFARIHAENPSSELWLLGDGALESQLRAQVGALRLNDSVKFLGYQPRQQFFELVGQLDEVWILGLGNDFAGRAALEARACGARVLTVDEGALGDWADAVVEPTVESIVAAALKFPVRSLPLPSSGGTVAELLEFYASASRSREASA
jgi:L-malate glycosyltransferase